MRIRGWRGIAALGLLSVASFAMAQPPKSKAMPPGFWNDLFSSKPKEEPKPKEPIGAKPAARADRAAEQDRLMKAYLRRLAVCDRLRDIANDTNDATLADEAARLDEMAWELYQEQSARLLGSDARALEDEPEKNASTKQASAKGPKTPRPSRFRPSAMKPAPRPMQEGEQ